MKIVATLSLASSLPPEGHCPNDDRWNTARSCQNLILQYDIHIDEKGKFLSLILNNILIFTPIHMESLPYLRKLKNLNTKFGFLAKLLPSSCC